ncbi:MAG TPA: DNA repair exonuclease [Firmicutes bacterium]|nr:DNA repair exonuclease [Candidatus Fermentithermobacillaceae bacterium]
MIKIVHCADIHAGRPASLELGPEKALTRRKEIEETLFRIVEIAREEKADLLLISGDLFEHKYARPSWAREAAEALGSIPDTRVFAAPGNHDPVLKDSLYLSTPWPKNVTVLLSPEWSEVVMEDKGVAVYGRGWTTYRETEPLLRGFHARRSDLLNLMLVHGELVNRSLEGSEYLPIYPEDVIGSGIHYLALGHIHAPSSVRLGDTAAVYAGCPEPLDFGDKGERGIYLVTAEKTARGDFSVKPEFKPIAKRQMKSAEVDITGLDTEERVRNAILSVDAPEARKRDLWAITLTGRVEPEISFETQSLERELSGEFFSLRISTDYWPDYDLQALADPDNQSLEGRFVRHLREMADERRAQGDSRGAEIAELAIYYGLDALRQGKVLLRGRRWN